VLLAVLVVWQVGLPRLGAAKRETPAVMLDPGAWTIDATAYAAPVPAPEMLPSTSAPSDAEPREALLEIDEAPTIDGLWSGLRGALPFRTQRDGSRWAGSNCGPAALSMVLAAFGIDQGNDDLRYLSHTYQGTWGMRTGTALQHIAHVADDFDLKSIGLYQDDGSFRRWSVDDVRAEVAQGHPVIALVKYRLLPGREGSTVRFDHYVVLWDLTADGFVYNDPIYPGADEGYARQMTNAQLASAMAPTMEPRQAVAFAVRS
jgi:hypothetical protein